MNPPCYRCESPTPLEAGRIGLCRGCEAEIEAVVNHVPRAVKCIQCGLEFVTDWERIQHAVNQRHNYHDARRA